MTDFFTLDDTLRAEFLCTRIGLSIVGAEKVTSPEHSRRFMLKPSIIYTDLFEAVSFSSKYYWNCSGELCCLYNNTTGVYYQV